MHCLMSAQVGIQLPMSKRLMAVTRCSTLIMTSLIANSPTITLMNSTPAVKVADPKVSRAAPVSGSWPMSEVSRPMAIDAIPFSRARPDRLMIRLSPMNIRAKYSGGPNTSAKSASSGAKNVRPTRLSVPATKEEMAQMAKAGPALPCLAISYPSSAVQTEDASPGMFTTMAVVDPPYMAP